MHAHIYAFNNNNKKVVTKIRSILLVEIGGY